MKIAILLLDKRAVLTGPKIKIHFDKYLSDYNY